MELICVQNHCKINGNREWGFALDFCRILRGRYFRRRNMTWEHRLRLQLTPVCTLCAWGLISHWVSKWLGDKRCLRAYWSAILPLLWYPTQQPFCLCCSTRHSHLDINGTVQIAGFPRNGYLPIPHCWPSLRRHLSKNFYIYSFLHILCY